MLHWLDMDQMVRKTMDDGKRNKEIRCFLEKQLKPLSKLQQNQFLPGRKGKRHGISTEYFYNGRKRRTISYEDGGKEWSFERIQYFR